MLGRTRAGLLLPGAPLDLDPSVLARKLASDDPRLVALASTGEEAAMSLDYEIRSRLEERLVSCLPAATFEMETLCRLAGIVESREIETAAVECRRHPRLLVNPDFVAEHCARDEHLFLLVMHELWHVILAHTRLYPRPTLAHNIAFDAVINAGLARQFPGPEYRGFFEALNPADTFPGCLLRPPEGWPAAPVLPDCGPPGTREIVARLYPAPEAEASTPTYQEILDLLAAALAARSDAPASEPFLLGDHADEENEIRALDDEVFGETVRRIVAAWPPPPFPLGGRDAAARHGELGHPARAALASTRASPSRGSCGARSAGIPAPAPRRRRGLVAAPGGLGVLPNSADRLRPSRRALGLARHPLDADEPEPAARARAARSRPRLPRRVRLDAGAAPRAAACSLRRTCRRSGRAQVFQFSTEVEPLGARRAAPRASSRRPRHRHPLRLRPPARRPARPPRPVPDRRVHRRARRRPAPPPRRATDRRARRAAGRVRLPRRPRAGRPHRHRPAPAAARGAADERRPVAIAVHAHRRGRPPRPPRPDRRRDRRANRRRGRRLRPRRARRRRGGRPPRVRLRHRPRRRQPPAGQHARPAAPDLARRARPRRGLAAAGYTGGGRSSHGSSHDLDLGATSPTARRGIRRFSDDQNVVVGYAEGSEATGWLPPAPFAARRLREALVALRLEHPDRLGPDGKVLVRIDEEDGAFRWGRVNVSLQHAPGAGDHESLYRLVWPVLEQLQRGTRRGPARDRRRRPRRRPLPERRRRLQLRRPFGDNGLSGKKLVVDDYGPGVPIGGGALCGKDPHKVDRIGALAARQLAVRLVRDAHARSARVTLGWLPGAATPDTLHALVDGEPWAEARIRAAIAVPDLSIEGTFQRLELAGVRWVNVMRRGYFGNHWAWER